MPDNVSPINRWWGVARSAAPWIAAALVATIVAGYAIATVALNTPRPFIATVGVSMEPTLHQGDLATIKNVDTATISVGDIIAFRTSQSTRETYNVPDVVLHRVTDITYDQSDRPVFETQGDGNPEIDPWLTSSANIEGVMVAQIDGGGWPLLIIQGPWGRNLAITIGALIALYYIVGVADRQRDATRARQQAHDEMLTAISELRAELSDLRRERGSTT